MTERKEHKIPGLLIDRMEPTPLAGTGWNLTCLPTSLDGTLQVRRDAISNEPPEREASHLGRVQGCVAMPRRSNCARLSRRAPSVGIFEHTVFDQVDP